jgi:hypothetical protein
MVLVVVNPMRRKRQPLLYKGEDGEEGHHSQHSYGLTGHFWIKLFENMSLERSFGYAGEEF